MTARGMGVICERRVCKPVHAAARVQLNAHRSNLMLSAKTVLGQDIESDIDHNTTKQPILPPDVANVLHHRGIQSNRPVVRDGIVLSRC